MARLLPVKQTKAPSASFDEEEESDESTSDIQSDDDDDHSNNILDINAVSGRTYKTESRLFREALDTHKIPGDGLIYMDETTIVANAYKKRIWAPNSETAILLVPKSTSIKRCKLILSIGIVPHKKEKGSQQ